MATPQFNVLEHLDQPWCQKTTLPALHEYWNVLSRTMDEWGNSAAEEPLAKTATTAAGGGSATS